MVETAMSNEPNSSSQLEKLAEEVEESINEEPEMEPGQADITPAIPGGEPPKISPLSAAP
jgi:hypothetical protein